MSRRAKVLCVCALALVTAHWLLGRALAGIDFMGALAAARHGHYGAISLGVVFLIVRLATVVLLPALLLAQAGAALFPREKPGAR